MGNTFVCDHCGQDVSINASECPKCHHLFKAVRCSACGYSGEPKEFGNGCPVCHYLGEKKVAYSKLASLNKKTRSQSVFSGSEGTLGLKTLILLLLGILVLISGIYFIFF